MRNDRTPKLKLALPHRENELDDDVERLRESLNTIDTLGGEAGAAKIGYRDKTVAARLDEIPAQVEAKGAAALAVGSHNFDANAHPEMRAFVTAEADRAQAAADLAQVASNVYSKIADGLAATAEGKYFSTPTPTDAGFLTLYQKVNGAAVQIKIYPSDKAVKDLEAKQKTLLRDAGVFTDILGDNLVEFADQGGKLALGVDKAGTTLTPGGVKVSDRAAIPQNGPAKLLDGISADDWTARGTNGTTDNLVEFLDSNGKLGLGVNKNGVTMTPGGIEISTDIGITEKGFAQVPAGFEIQGVTIEPADRDEESPYALRFCDEKGATVLGFLKDSSIEIFGFKVQLADTDNLFELVDKRGVLAAGFDKNGNQLVGGTGPSQQEQPPFAISLAERIHLIIYGQSLSNGHLGTPPIATSTPQTYMFNTGVRSLDKTPTSLVPLAEQGNQTVCASIAHGLIANSPTQFASRELVLNAGGVNGERIINLMKGKSPYTGLVKQVNWLRQLSWDTSKQYDPAILVWLQGEADAADGLGGDVYEARLSQLLADMNADMHEPSNSAIPMQLFTYQFASHGYYNGTAEHAPYEIALAHHRIAYSNPNAQCVGPMYIFTYADQVHLNNHGYRWYGLYVEKAIRHWLTTGTKWHPLEPTSARRISSTAVMVDFYVPVPPLVFDTSIVTQLPDGMNGFELWDDTGRLEVVSTEIVGGTKVKVTAATPIGTNPRVRYGITPHDRGVYDAVKNRWPDWKAGAQSGVRGTLRDSDPTKTDLLNYDGNPYPLHNYCVIFDLEVN